MTNTTLELKPKVNQELEQLVNVTDKRIDRIWKRAQKVGIVGILTIASAAPLAIAGFVDTDAVRSPYFNYAWGSILGGHLICAGGYLTNMYLGKRILNGVPREVREELLRKHQYD